MYAARPTNHILGSHLMEKYSQNIFNHFRCELVATVVMITDGDFQKNYAAYLCQLAYGLDDTSNCCLQLPSAVSSQQIDAWGKCTFQSQIPRWLLLTWWLVSQLSPWQSLWVSRSGHLVAKQHNKQDRCHFNCSLAQSCSVDLNESMHRFWLSVQLFSRTSQHIAAGVEAFAEMSFHQKTICWYLLDIARHF